MPARFGAYPAMVVVLRVFLAFVGTNRAREHARVELGMDEVARRFRLAREDAERRRANVGAIEVGANAAAKVGEVLRFGEAGVGAGGAGCHAGREGRERLGVDGGALLIGAWVITEHQFDGFHAKKVPHPAMRQSGGAR